MNPNRIHPSIFVGLAVLLAGIFMWYYRTPEPPEFACTADAKMCEDGSFVGRTGPKCEFAPCPADSYLWKIGKDTTSNLSFRYPDPLPQSPYIVGHEWPPKITVTPEVFSCSKKVRVISGNIYCIESTNGAAAGSMYTEYTYKTAYRETNTLTMKFTLRTVNCGNYATEEQKTCEEKEATLNVDSLANRIAATVQEGTILP